ncbi:MAG: LicD family protein [Candidatus Algichlamydia australiensis]|nr:LicD family protein [Chlamydiales bacterium]
MLKYLPLLLLLAQLQARLLINAPAHAKKLAKQTDATLLNPKGKTLKQIQREIEALDHYHNLTPIVILDNSSFTKKELGSLANRTGYKHYAPKKISAHRIKKACAKLPKTIHDIPPLPKETAKQLYNFMAKVDKLFTKYDLTYWAGGGTLLGAVRHKGLIPWDDDLDIYMLEQDETTLLSLKKELLGQGIALHYLDEGDFYKLSPLNGKKMGSEWTFPFIDIFFFRKEEETYYHRSPFFRRDYPNDTYAASQIQNRKRCAFGPTRIWIPAQPKQALDRLYGRKDYPRIWQDFAKTPHWDHQNERPAKGAQVYIRL